MGTINHGDAQLFINWLKKQPREATYDYGDHKRCLIAQYLTACGNQNVRVGVSTFSFQKDGKVVSGYLPYPLDIIANRWPPTFGAALDRAFLEFNRIADAGGDNRQFKPF